MELALSKGKLTFFAMDDKCDIIDQVENLLKSLDISNWMNPQDLEYYLAQAHAQAESSEEESDQESESDDGPTSDPSNDQAMEGAQENMTDTEDISERECDAIIIENRQGEAN